MNFSLDLVIATWWKIKTTERSEFMQWREDSKSKHTSLAFVPKITLTALFLRGLEPISIYQPELKIQEIEENVSWKSVVLNSNREGRSI